jgi:hypothetical protein
MQRNHDCKEHDKRKRVKNQALDSPPAMSQPFQGSSALLFVPRPDYTIIASFKITSHIHKLKIMFCHEIIWLVAESHLF